MMRWVTTPASLLRLGTLLSLVGAAICSSGFESRMNSALNDVLGNDTSARILLVRHFEPGEFTLPTRDPEGLPILRVPRAQQGVTVVKFFIRTNGSDAPEEPSPNSGTDVGLEIWFPDPLAWNGRIYSHVAGGFQGDVQVVALNASSSETWKGRYTSQMASELGYVSGVTNGGQSNPRGIEDMQWLLNDDGTWNMEGWKNANWQATHLLSVKSKAIAKAYYGKPARYSYIYGCSTGGRGVYKTIQQFPGDYDGYLSACPSINQGRLFPSLGHPFIVMNNHLHQETAFTDIQLEVVVQRALQNGDTDVTGKHDGYFSKINSNHYDPTKDLSLLSVEEGGNCTQDWAFTKRQLEAINQIWYGPTLNGSIPDPSVSTGTDPKLASDQLWWGKLRGSLIAFALQKRFIVGNMFAVMLKDPSLAPDSWNHPLANSTDAWSTWSYEKYAKAILDLERIDAENFQMASNDPDLRPAKKAGAKMITYHALADPGVAPQSSISYYHKSAGVIGRDKVNDFHRLFLVPGQDHCIRASGVAGSGNPPIPTVEEWLELLVNWVENGKAPDHIIAHSVDNAASRPICMYPRMAKYKGHGDVSKASSFNCEGSFY
ncbi:hypothetical protein NW754_007349 [Fusarium falciforme]|uniref:Carboxylic ester hydrolase n=1 Tax=Fusarium falciforme TaxID=195108 RepID=A0A9W8R9A6_9HYPO|nr:hypothetical protein NW754_007349 [Fusarium falciforme]KAJ4188504.1 hypothetical protein NW755_006666 [Fusarium falciforme]KAJ4239287.1 hypothetical protein NW757_012879 [Fusarium falciforme]